MQREDALDSFAVADAARGKSRVQPASAPPGDHSLFFSSRRRHTRFDCDWSSDVCSSDLRRERLQTIHIARADSPEHRRERNIEKAWRLEERVRMGAPHEAITDQTNVQGLLQIGRASCRERV